MPFEIAPQPEVQTFQKFADALLRGCAITKPIQGGYFCGPDRACAMGALALGLVGDMNVALDLLYYNESVLSTLRNAYITRYGHGIAADNDSGDFTREQIAARIAAL